MIPATFELVEVSPRDGLQNEPGIFSTDNKLELIRRALAAGIRRIEVASFVHPKVVPQMADAEAVCSRLPDSEACYVGLVLNVKGLERALATGRIDEVGAVAVASDGFGVRNQQQTVTQSIEVCQEVITDARAAGLRAQVTISVAFGCPFDGPVATQRVVEIARELAAAEPLELALADTIGVANPVQVQALFAEVRSVLPDQIQLRGHFHNTRNTGYANAAAALQEGVPVLDASIGGVGGCPFAPRATGNIASEDLLFMTDGMGCDSGVDLDQVINAAGWLGAALNRPVPGMLSRAGNYPESVEERLADRL
ncbi:MAG: hydroxymethylglutaryl-CoA lyase [Pseudomonadota bacterium]